LQDLRRTRPRSVATPPKVDDESGELSVNGRRISKVDHFVGVKLGREWLVVHAHGDQVLVSGRREMRRDQS
jgi:hypothetical protein